MTPKQEEKNKKSKSCTCCGQILGWRLLRLTSQNFCGNNVNKFIVTVILLFMCFFSKAQNLVPNNGFDTYTSCPNAASQFNLTPPWGAVNNFTGTPDYMNTCFFGGTQGVPNNFYGYQQPVSNSGYYGLITYFENQEVREYLTVPLSSPLVGGTSYTIGFHVSLSENFKYATDHFGAYLSIGAISGFGNYLSLPFNPQIDNFSGNIISDTTNWTIISGIYTATGGEDYLTIGNFHNDANTLVSIANPSASLNWAYYYVDEVFVIPIPLEIIGNNNICLGDSVTLQAVGDTQYSWANSLNPSSILSIDSLLIIAPVVTSTYFVYGNIDTASFTVYVTPSPIIDLGNDTTLCQGQTLSLDATTSNATYLWQDNDSTATYNVSQQGTYWLNITINNCSSSDTIIVNYTNALPVVNLGNDTTLCQGQTLTLDVSAANIDAYLWQDNSIGPSFNINQQGSYYVDVLNNCGMASDTIQVTFQALPFVDLGNDTTLCEGNSLLLNASTNNVSFQWQDNSTDSTYNITQQGIYWVQVLAACGAGSDTINVNFNALPIVNLGNDTTLCFGQTLSLDATTSNATYHWQDNASNATYNISQQGTYWLNITINNCSSTDTIIVNYTNDLPVVDLGNDTTLCEGQSIILDASSPSATYLWQDNSTSPTLVVSQQGTYLIQVTNGCGLASDSIHLDFNQLPQLALSNIISPSCYGLSNGSATVTAQGTGALIYVWNAGLANGPTINQVSSGNYSVAVYDAIGCSNTMNVTINSPDSIIANITSTNATCAIDNGSAQINASGGTGTLTYAWSNNANSNLITDLSEGNYTVIITDSMGCEKVVQTAITQGGLFSIDAGTDQEIDYGSSIELVGLGPENGIYNWWPIDYLTCGECANTIANPVETTEYILTVVNNGCKVIDTVLIKVDEKCSELFVPTAFSPNSDDVNNILLVRGNCITEFNFKIFDRWGEIIFESNDQNTGWDGTFKGKPLNEGVYVYIIEAEVKGKYIFLKGNVSLIRN